MEAVTTYDQAFFGWLLQTTLIASLVICLILLIQKFLGGRLGPRWSYVLWLVLLIRMILPWSPSSRVSLSNLIPSWQRQIQSQQLPGTIEEQEVSPPEQAAESPEAIASHEAESEIATQEQATQRPRTVANAEAQSRPRLASIRRVLPILWLAGAIVIGMYLLLSDLALWRIVKRDSPLVNQAMLELFEECKAQMGVQSLVVVVPSDRVRSPGLFGFVRPRLLLPRQMLDSATTEEMRYVFLHELAHLRRHDIYIGWLTSLLQVLHWFNPLVWFAFYRMRSDRELACDALVLTRTGQDKSQEYGGAIVELVRRFSRSRPLPAMAGIIESQSQLKRRIAMITKFKNNSYRFSPLAAISIIILASVSLPDAIRTKTSQAFAVESGPPIMLRRVWSGPDVDTLGAPSADGRYLSYVDWETGDLAIRELDTGRTRRLTKEATWNKPMAFALNSTISPSNKLVAYSWFNKHETYDLRLIGIDSSNPRTIYSRRDYEAYPHEFSPDGRHIATFLFNTKDKNGQLVWISAADGSVKVLKQTVKGHTTADCVCHSPNGLYIAYDLPVKKDSGRYDINLLAIDGSDDVSLIEHPANDKLLGWVPGRNEILFLSDRAGTQDLWVIQVRNSRPQGSPRRIKSSIGQISPMGFTQNGSYYFDISSRLFNTYIATLDLETGKMLAPLSEPFMGSNFLPEWSPDGESIAYLSEEIKPSGLGFFDDILHIRSLKTGQDRKVSCELKRLSNPRWSPDGHSILVSGYDRNNKQDEYNGGLYKIDVKDGKVTSLVQYAAGTLGTGEWGRITGEWSPDGKAIFYINRESILIRQLESSRETQLYNNPNLVAEQKSRLLALSPDGQRIVFGLDEPEAGGQSLMIMPASGGKPHELLKLDESGRIKAIAWTPNGKYVLYTREKKKGTSIWRITPEGGYPQKLWETEEDLRGLRINADKQQIAFYSLKKGKEVWVMENFLPGAPVAESEPEPVPTLRQIEVRGRGTRHSYPSFDGKYMSDVDRATENLVIRDLATGKQWNLTNKDSKSGDFADWSAISPDSTKVIYYWFNAEKKDFDLRVVGLDGSGDRLLWGSKEGARSFNMGAWSPDGRYIFGKFFGQNDQLMRISTEDGSRQIIRTFDGKGLSKVDVSSDGRYVAYAVAGKTTSNRDIFVFDLETNEETPLVEHPANDKLLGWTPDGQHIFFASDRNGTWDGWLVQIVDGKPDGIPEVVKPGIGNIVPVGFTRNGSFYYTFQHEAWNVYTAALDSNTGQVTSDPEPLRHVGRDIRPDWSPDGRYIAYLSEIDRSKPQIIRIRTLATGRERELKIDIPRFDWLRWCPDSRHLLITSFNRGSPSVVYRLDAKTGEYNTLVKSDEQRIRQAELSADGKTLAYRTRGLGNANRLIVRDMETGSEKELLRTDVMDAAYLSPFAGGWTLSPDGKQVALSVREGEGDEPLKPLVLKVLSITSGELKTLVGAPVGELAWTRDGSSLLFVKDLAELWCVSAKGGEPRRLWKWKQMIWGPRIDPDGQRIAFHSGGYVSEMWVMENFLPEEMGK